MHIDAIHGTYFALFIISTIVWSFANNQTRGALNREAVLQLSEFRQMRARSWPTRNVVFPEAQKFITIRNYAMVLSVIMFSATTFG